MTITIIITICCLFLIAYIFDLTSSFTRIPSVILLLFLGWITKQGSILFGIQIPDLSTLLPIFGTIGLILIVLEGSLELEFNKSKLPLIRKSVFAAFVPIIGLSFLLAFAIAYFEQLPFKVCLLNAIPISIISSAIAIPSVRYLTKGAKEFIVYESSLSDIFGVLFFNFVAVNTIIDASSLGHFTLQLILVCIISLIATIGLAFLLSNLKHHIKFAPIIILIVLIYSISKIFHLPALIFIMSFGLFLGNLDELKGFKWLEKAKPDILDKEVHKFKEFVIEGAFLIRTIFFILFGYLLDVTEILNLDTLIWACGIVFIIFLFRFLQLKAMKMELKPLLYIAPRGLITILLFLSINPLQTIPLVNKSLIIQIILLTAVVMMAGLMGNRTNKKIK